MITDDNLRLALVERLIGDDVLPEFDRREFVLANDLPRGENEDGPDYDDVDDNPDYHIVPEIKAELVSWLLPRHLPLVDSILWEGGMRTQHWIWTFWDGESDEFDIESLAGIEGCTALRTLSLRNNSAIRDLGPLAAVTTLERVALSGRFRDITPLRALPRLVELDLSYVTSVKDLRPLRGHPTLETLDIKSTSVEDLSFARELPRLKKLVVSEEAAQTVANEKTISTLANRGVEIEAV